ncbi:hypothetical protein J112_19140 [Mycobacterium tuberculosis str. Beijing/NITR203]|nr:hypothetical protein J112_19140 [Mycobacterium tuberculosis str. Beijing/NITR203]
MAMDELPWPVLGSEVLAAKAIPERAMRQLWEPVYPGVYAPAGVELTARQRAHEGGCGRDAPPTHVDAGR